MSEFTKVSIVIGTVTETDSLRDTVKIINELCSTDDVEEIIIGYPPDRVTEDCKAVIDEVASAGYPIPIITLTDQSPFLHSIIDGMFLAKGSHTILCPSDMAVDLKCIPLMIKCAKSEPDVIFTSSRFLPGCDFYGYGKIKLMFNRMAQVYLRILFNTKLTDITSPYQIAPRKIYTEINYESTGFPILLEMILKPLRLGYKIKEVPTNCYGRKQGKSGNSFVQTAMYLKTSLHVRFMKKEDILIHPNGD